MSGSRGICRRRWRRRRLGHAILVIAVLTVTGATTSPAQVAGLTEIEFEGDHTIVTSLSAYERFIGGERPAQKPFYDIPLNQDRFPPFYAGPSDCYRTDRPVEYGRRCSLLVSVRNPSSEAAWMRIRVEGDVAASEDGIPPTQPMPQFGNRSDPQRVEPGETADFTTLIEHRSTGDGTVTVSVLSDELRVATATYTFEGGVWLPSAPTNVHLGTRPDSLVLIWDRPINDGGSPLTGYEVRLLEVNPDYDPTIVEGDRRRWLRDTWACNFVGRPELTTCDMPNNDLTVIEPGTYQLRVQAFNDSGAQDTGPYFYGQHFTDPFVVQQTLATAPPSPPNRPPILETSTPFVDVLVGSPVRIPGSVSDPDGDPLVLTTSIGALEVTDSAWVWSHPGFLQPGTTTVSVTATDAEGAASTVYLTVTATRSPPPAIMVSTAISVEQIVAASDYDPVSHARVLRLYQAIFGRYPDVAGAKYWIDLNNHGHGVLAIAGYMSVSSEWSTTYRGTADAEFVAAVYTNVLGRDYDLAGYLYWLDLIETGRLSRPQMVYYVTANAEFTRAFPFQP